MIRLALVAWLVPLVAIADEAAAPAPAQLVPPSAVELPEIAVPEGAVFEKALSITVTIRIEPDGTVGDARLVEGAGEPFDTAVLEGVRRFRFNAATYGGAPVSVEVPFTHTFVPAPTTPVENTSGPAPTASLKGLVVERGTRAPVPDAAIVLTLDGGREVVVRTDKDGLFIAPLPPGELEVRVASSQHQRFVQRVRLTDGEELKVRLLIDRISTSPYEARVVGKPDVAEVSRTSLEGRELKQVPGTFGDPFKVIMVLPGVTSAMSLLPLPIVRGTSPGNTGLFLDGMRLPLLFHLLGGPSVVHPELVDRIDFFPGSFPVRYGGYTGGIVDGVTRAPAPGKNTIDLDLNLLQAGVFTRTWLPSADLTVTAAGRYGYPGILLGLVQDEIDLSYWDYQLRVDRGTAWSGFTVFVYGANDELERRQPLPEDPTQYGPFERVALFRFHRADLRLRFGNEEANGVARLLAGVDESGLGPTATRQFVLQPMLRGDWKFGEKLALRTGLDSAWRTSELVAGVETGFDLPDTSGLLQTEGVLSTNDVFAELVWTPDDRWVVVPGIRTDFYFESAGDRTRWTVDPRLLVRRRMGEGDGLVMKGAVGVFHQPPRFAVPIPGLDLSPLALGMLESLQSSIGVEWKPAPGLEIDVQGYFNWMDPVLFDFEVNPSELFADAPTTLPGQAPEDQPNRVETTLENFFKGRKGRGYGLELLLRRRDEDGLFGWISYTLSRSERLEDAGWRAFDFDRLHVLNLVAGMKLPRNWEVGSRLMLQTGTPLSTLSGHNAGRAEPQVRFDVRVDKRVVWNEWLLDFYVDVINLTVSQEAGGLTGALPVRYVLPTVGLRAVL